MMRSTDPRAEDAEVELGMLRRAGPGAENAEDTIGKSQGNVTTLDL